MDGGAPVKRPVPIRPPSLMSALQPKGVSKPKLPSIAAVKPRPMIPREVSAAATKINVNPLDLQEALQAVPVPIATEVGVSSRDALFQTLLRVFAKSDFKHDFGEKVPSRDWITKKDRTRFAEMVQKFPVKKRVDMMNKFDALFPDDTAGTNLVALLKDGIAGALYPGPPGTPAEFVHEEDILSKVGINYKPLKESIKAHFAANPTAPFADEKTFTVGKLFTRNYRIGAQKYKNNDATAETPATTRNLASLFKDATGGKTNFAILVDASLGMSVSKIGDSTLTPDPGAACNFIVLQNVESDADSATGSSSFAVTPGGANSTSVTVVSDKTTSTVLYPIWEDPSLPRSDPEILFSKIQILLNRVEAGDVEASILLGDESHTIPNIGTTSNVKNASLNGLAALFTNQLLGTAATEGDNRRPYIYALLKRMGDWCQALSLLDRTREYVTESGEGVTIHTLITNDYEVGLVTNDRILLAYGLVLGLNVYFTTAADLGCLLYFRNNDDIVDQPALEQKAARNVSTFASILPVGEGGLSPEIQKAIQAYSAPIPLDQLSATIKSSFVRQNVVNDGVLDGIVNAFRTKVILSNLGELRTNFKEIERGINDAIDIFNNPDASPRDKLVASVNLVNFANKYNTDVTHNKSVMERLMKGMFSGTFTAQQNVFVDLAKKMAPGGKLAISEIMSRAKEVLLSCRDDIKQVLQKNIMPPDQLSAYIPAVPIAVEPPGRPTQKDVANFEVLYGAFNSVLTEIPSPGAAVGGAQRGGDLALLRSVLQREVFPYKSAKLETTVKRLTESGKTAELELLEFLPAVQVGSYYRDDKSRPYSVIDRYLITKEDSKVLVKLFGKILVAPGANPEAANFILYRLALLYRDILYERYEHIMDDSNVEGTLSRDLEIEDAEVTEGSEIEYGNVSNEVLLLRVLITRYANGEKIDNADLLKLFTEGVGVELLEKYRGMFTPAEGVFERTDVETNLASIRDVIFAKYQPQTIATFTTVTEAGEEVEETTENLERFLDSEGGNLQGGADTPPNAATLSGSSRRRLYAGLRKRTGSGSPSEL